MFLTGMDTVGSRFNLYIINFAICNSIVRGLSFWISTLLGYVSQPYRNENRDCLLFLKDHAVQSMVEHGSGDHLQDD